MQCTQTLWVSQHPQAEHSLRSIVPSRGLVTYGVAKVLTKILKPLVGRSPHHIHSTQDFVEQANEVKLLLWECCSSYDVTALFTSVPVEPELGIIKDLLEQDNTPRERTVLLVKDIILLLEFCLHNTYFSFQGQFYEQVEGEAVGSLVSPVVGGWAIPSLIPLSNQKLMVDCLSQYIGSLPTQINIYSGTVTITYQPSIV